MFKIALFLCGLLFVAASTFVADPGVNFAEPNPQGDCGLSEGRGLHRVMRELAPLILRERYENIIANAAFYDEEVRNFLNVLRSNEFRMKVARLRATEEYRVLYDYICRAGLNYGFYIDFVRLFMNLRTTKAPSRPIENARPGIWGLFKDLLDALPQRQISEIYDRLFEVDDGLEMIQQAANTPEWRLLLGNYRNTDAYQDIRITLANAGVQILSEMELVNAGFGWDPNFDRGVERALWEV